MTEVVDKRTSSPPRLTPKQQYDFDRQVATNERELTPVLQQRALWDEANATVSFLKTMNPRCYIWGIPPSFENGALFDPDQLACRVAVLRYRASVITA